MHAHSPTLPCSLAINTQPTKYSGCVREIKLTHTNTYIHVLCVRIWLTITHTHTLSLAGRDGAENGCDRGWMHLSMYIHTKKYTLYMYYVMVNVRAVREVAFNTGRGRSPSLVCENDRGNILYAPRRRILTIL